MEDLDDVDRSLLLFFLVCVEFTKIYQHWKTDGWLWIQNFQIDVALYQVRRSTWFPWPANFCLDVSLNYTGDSATVLLINKYAEKSRLRGSFTVLLIDTLPLADKDKQNSQ